MNKILFNGSSKGNRKKLLSFYIISVDLRNTQTTKAEALWREEGVSQEPLERTVKIAQADSE